MSSRPRRSTREASGSASALADLKRMKESGRTGRAAEYEVTEEAAVYDEVDDATYAEISARQRAAARSFVERGDGDEEGYGDEDEDEEEMALEDEMSVIRKEVRGTKRARGKGEGSAKGKKKKGGKKVKKARVSAAFLNAGLGEVGQEEDAGPSVFDAGELEREMEDAAKMKKRKKEKKRRASNLVGDLMFGTGGGGGGGAMTADADFGMSGRVVTAVQNVDMYTAPPPMAPGAAQGEDPDEIKVKTAAEILADATPEGGAMDVKAGGSGARDESSPAAAEDSDSGASGNGGKNGDDMNVDKTSAVAKLSADVVSSATPVASLVITSKQRAQASVAVAAAAAARNSAVGQVRAGAPLARDENGDLLMFWTDATEMRVNGGEVLYLFGKAEVDRPGSGVYASVCVVVQGVERALYVLPRKDANPVKDVYPEVMARLRGGRGAGSSNQPTEIKAKPVERMCPFGDRDAPREPTTYLKVKFPFTKTNSLGADASGKTFKRVYGMKTSASEMLCLERGLKGPSWLRIKSAQSYGGKVSHARHTLQVLDPSSISVATDLADRPSPSVTMLCLSTKTVLNERTGAHEIVMISGVFAPEVPLDCALDPTLLDSGAAGSREFVLLRPPDGKPVPLGFQERARAVSVTGGGSVEVMPNESALLNNFTAKLLQLDPDAILGHDMLGFGLDVLLARMAAHRTRKWSCLGRLVQTRDLKSVVKNQASTSYFKAEAVSGRLVCDTMASAKEILYKEKDYSLSALSANVLRLASDDPAHLPAATEINKIPLAYAATETLCLLLRECSAEARTAGRLSARLSILPLSKQLTCISGNLWSRTLQGARAQRIEFLLCHEFLKVGSKLEEHKAKSSAGNTTCKLLLPDKLSKAERQRVEEMGVANVKPDPDTKKVVKPEDVKNAGAGFGGGFDEDADQNATPAAKASNFARAKGYGATSGKATGKSTRRKPQYSGGLVLEPQKGLYDRFTLQLDFNSLYPSIIQEFNICFTTLNLSSSAAAASDVPMVEGEDDINAEAKTPGSRGAAVTSMFDLLPDSSVGVGVLPRVLHELVSTRRKVKMMLKQETNPVLRSQLDIRQTAIKLTANSLYGCLGFEGSRFYAQTMAALVTSQGRDTLQNTMQVARDEFNAQVIYGDTDSIFVYTGLDDIKKVQSLGFNLKKNINARYKTLEIEIDAIYSKMLLLKKKKYAAMKVVNPLQPNIVEREVKGLDLVRHDWCDLSHDASEKFLAAIFSVTDKMDDAVGKVLTYLETLASDVRNNKIGLSKYVITKSITKDPNLYPDKKGLPHVQVALRMRKNGRRVQSGDYIKYVICKNASDESGSKIGSSSHGGMAQHAYHPDEVMASEGELVIDFEYYLENQVLPPIMRLVDPIESIEGSRLASALGLDAVKYSKREAANAHVSLLDTEMFKDVTPLLLKCARCKSSAEFNGVQFSSSKKVQSTGLDCPKCSLPISMANVSNAMRLNVRKWQAQYYSSEYKMNHDDGARARTSRNIGLGGHASLLKREFDELWVYTQLRYIRSLFDPAATWKRLIGGANGGDISSSPMSSAKKEQEEIPLKHRDTLFYEDQLVRATEAFEMNAYRLITLDVITESGCARATPV